MSQRQRTQYGSLIISGPDAYKLLQGQLTCDLDNLGNTGSYGAHCNHQGRIISLFHIHKDNDHYQLIMPASMLQIALNALKKYAVFYKVNLTADQNKIPDIEQLNLFDINQGIPNIYPDTSEKFLPHELCLDKLKAISFEKGCYTGQEIIARMEYRGKVKKQIHLASISSTQPPSPGDDIYYAENNKPAGCIIDTECPGNQQYNTLILCHPDDVKENSLIAHPDNNPIHFQEKQPCQKT